MSWITANGRMKYTAVNPTEVVIPDNSAVRLEFEAACASFRSLCASIGELIGNPDFKGGFDEMAEFEASPAAASNEGIALAIRWIAADNLCTYLASKLGIGQPAWWYECWEPVIDEEAVVEEADDAKLTELEL